MVNKTVTAAAAELGTRAVLNSCKWKQLHMLGPWHYFRNVRKSGKIRKGCLVTCPQEKEFSCIKMSVGEKALI